MVAALAVSCGTAAERARSQPEQSESPSASTTPSTPDELLQQILAKLDTTDIVTAGFDAAPGQFSDAKNPWLFVKLAADQGAAGVLPEFYALLLGGAYSSEAGGFDLPPMGGLTYYSEQTPGCEKSPRATACEAPSGRESIGAIPYTTPGESQEELEAEIKHHLDALGLTSISISFAEPRSSLVPIVVAQTLEPEGFTRDHGFARDEVFGPSTDYEGNYLEVVDSSGRPVLAIGTDSPLSESVFWMRPDLYAKCCGAG